MIKKQIIDIINDFWTYLNKTKIEIYNEFSLQHELGFFLRNRLPNYKVQFERNVGYFCKDASTIKREIDIVIFNTNMSEKYAIEIKSPRNGQYPGQMFQFVKDICFAEELKELGFNGAFALCLVADHNFYSGKAISPIYSYFRLEHSLNGEVKKPIGKKDEKLTVHGTYIIHWDNKLSGFKNYIIEAR